MNVPTNIDENERQKIMERLEKYRKTIENYKQNQELLVSQMAILKAEIKNSKQHLEDIKNYNGRIANYEEFKGLVLKVLEDFRPKKKDLEEAVKRIKEQLVYENTNQYDQQDNVSVAGSVMSNATEKKKGGFMGMFSNKKNK